MISTATRLLADYGSRTLTRARNYVQERRVLEIDADDETMCLTAWVRGTRRQPYEVTVDWSSGCADGTCTCPVEFDCKHAAAAVLAHFSAPDTAPERHVAAVPRIQAYRPSTAEPHDPAFDEWLARLSSAGESNRKRTSESKECILYLLDLKTRPGLPCARVTVCKGRRRKMGGYGGVQQYDPRNALSGSPPQFVRDVDLEILYRLAQTRGESGAFSKYLLTREGNAKLLPFLLDTGRCHWQTTDSPALRPGPSREGRWQWMLDETGGQRLTLRTDVEAQALPLAPPWYVDTESGECGPLRANVTDKMAQALLQSPRIGAAQLKQTGKQLAERLPVDLPRPREIEVEVRADCMPRPILRLGVQQSALQSWYGPMSEAWAELKFDYGGIEIAAADRRANLERMEGDRLLRIERNSLAEVAANDVLNEFQPYYVFGAAKVDIPAGAMTLGNEPEDWLDFIVNEIPRLEREGWRIDIARGFPLQGLSSHDFDLEIESGEDWFGVGLGIVVDGERVNLLPLLLNALAALPARSRTSEAIDEAGIFYLPLGDKRSLAVPATRIKPILSALIELYDAPPLTADGHLKLSRLDAARLADLDGIEGIRWQGGKALKALGEKLRKFDGVKSVTVPRTFKGQLRDYQKTGIDWLQFLRGYDFNGILADDMGLGKTVQALAHLLVEKRARRADRPSLLVAPTSLLHNWREEAARFAPSLRLLTLHGADRGEKFERIEDHDLVLTTYPLLPRDAEALKATLWHYIILDEAQVIKNPRTKAARVVCDLQARHRLCLTGTPMENHLGELWSLFRFLMPGFLGDAKSFRRLYRTPVEKHDDKERRTHLARRVRPFLLRRTKDAVAAELPPKTEMVQSIDIEGAQRDLYESVRLAMHKKIRDVVATKGFARSHIEILEALLKLRQVCCDPRLLKGPSGQRSIASAKLEYLMELLPGLLEDGRRVLLFSQFTEMLGLIETAVERQQIRYTKLTGRTRNRAESIRRFQNGEVPLMLISLKAGGVGLNLTAADAVIHYDPWWNPAVETQATDRAHRIGQHKPVFVYKLICAGTVEERIQAMQQRKRTLLQSVYAQNGGETGALDRKDMEALFEPFD